MDNTEKYTVALAGNPNVGKSTVFNALTGLRQHTGNWPGKTVAGAVGTVATRIGDVLLVDVPGTYSLEAHSPEEEVARDYICGTQGVGPDGMGERRAPDAVICVCDACCLERNLILAMQIMERGLPVLLCVNLCDEAEARGINVDFERLSERLGVPVVACAAPLGTGLDELRLTVADLLEEVKHSGSRGGVVRRGCRCEVCDAERLCGDSCTDGGFCDADRTAAGCDAGCSDGSACISFTDVGHSAQCASDRTCCRIVSRKFPDISSAASDIASECVTECGDPRRRDRRLDRIFTGRVTAMPVTALLLALVFFITLRGATPLSDFLTWLLGYVELGARQLFTSMHLPQAVTSALCDGVLRVLCWVVAVMLPPMAIFFPLFTILEDSGYLPRVAYNFDRCFHSCGACGKQALTTMMGFGCNAAGVTGCRIIDSPRERIIAIITNSFVPCNGRFPVISALLAILTAGLAAGGTLRCVLMCAVIVFGLVLTLAVSFVLSRTVLRGVPSSFTLELPPYRRPRIGEVIVRSVLDRTVFVLGRAAAVAAPAGLVIWLLGNVTIGGATLFSHITAALDPIGRAAGMDGVMMCAFVLAIPASEIILPLMIMGYCSGGVIAPLTGLGELPGFFASHGWSRTTAVCAVVFTLIHWPCSTTIITAYRETGSVKWTAATALIPTVIGYVLCVLINAVSGIFT